MSKITDSDVSKFIDLLKHFNDQTKIWKHCYQHFSQNYKQKFENKQASIQDVCILIFLIDFICVTRQENKL
jgi:hypothetical protein